MIGSNRKVYINVVTDSIIVTGMPALRGDISKGKLGEFRKAKTELDAKNNGEAIEKLLDFYNRNKGRMVL